MTAVGEFADSVGDAGAANAVQSPGASHQEGGFAGFKQHVGGVPVGAVGQETFVKAFHQPFASGDHARAVNAQVAGIVVASGVTAEDVAAESGLEREGVVGGAGEGEAVGGNARVAQVVTNCDYLVPGGGSVGGQVGVAEEGQIFDSVGHTVQVAVNGESGLGDIQEIAVFCAQVNGEEQTAGG